MSKAKGPLHSSDARGTIGDAFFFSNWKGKHRVQKHFKPHNPRTATQQQQRQYLADAILSWRTLTNAQKQEYEQMAIASGKRMSGYNYYLSDYIRQMLVPVVPPILDGLISWWKFDENQGSIAYDSHGTNNGTIFDAQWTTGKINSALTFDGDSDYVRPTPKSSFDLDIDDPFTMEQWIYLYEAQGYKYFQSKQMAPSPYYGYSFHIGYGHTPYQEIWQLMIRTSTGQHGDAYALISGGINSIVNKWTHIVVVYDASGDMQTTKIYQDGQSLTIYVLAGYRYPTGSMLNDRNFNIGSRDDAYVSGWTPNGKIDEVRIYNKALTQEEVQHNYSL